MAGSSLLALLDDISTMLDDVAILTKLAAKKTAGVLGDDLALNAQQVSGVRAERELAVVWAVARGSLVNKAILVPAALAIGYFARWAVIPLLMVGGAFLCFEGVEKLAHKFLHSAEEDQAHEAEITTALADESVDLVAFEKDKIKGAVRTDFILSAEIIAITLGAVAQSPFTTQVAVLVGIALLMTVGVYGVVAGIVKLDDLGLHLCARQGEGGWPRLARRLGAGILKVAPYLMKFLSVAGTLAMFLVGGGIITHGIGPVHHAIEGWAEQAGAVPGVGGLLEALTPSVLSAIVGVLVGAVVLVAVNAIKRAISGAKAPA